jgi:hypothetical protein
VYQFRDLIEINQKGEKLKEIFNCLGVQLPNFQSSGVKVKMCLLVETSPLLVGEPCDLLHPDSTGDLKICNKSNSGPRPLPTISFVEDTVLQRQD